MLDQELAELLSLIFGSNAKRPEGKYLLPHAVLVLKPCLRVHDIADDLSRLCWTRAVKLKHECQLWDEVGITGFLPTTSLFLLKTSKSVFTSM